MATAAARLGLTVRVHMPTTAPRAKREALLALGAQLVEASTYDEAEANVREDVARTAPCSFPPTATRMSSPAPEPPRWK